MRYIRHSSDEVNVKKLLLLATLPALLAACAPPPVRRESDLAWSEVVVSGTTAQVFRSIEERTRRCGFLVDTFTAEGSFYPDTKEQALDLRTHFGAESIGFGRLRMAPADGGTLVRVGTPRLVGGVDKKNAQALRAVLADPALPCDFEG